MQGPITTPQFEVGVHCQHSDGRSIPAKMLYNTAASTNLVSQRYALSIGWRLSPNFQLPETVSWGNGLSVHIYRAYEVVWKATDSWGSTREQRTIFYGVELSGHPLLLGILGMQEQ